MMVKKFISGEEGQGLIEYVLILFFIVLVAIVGVKIFGSVLKSYYNNTANKINTSIGE